MAEFAVIPSPNPKVDDGENLELYVKITVNAKAAAEWVRRVYEVDHVDPEVAAGIIGSSLVGPKGIFVRPQFIGLMRKGGRR